MKNVAFLAVALALLSVAGCKRLAQDAKNLAEEGMQDISREAYDGIRQNVRAKAEKAADDVGDQLTGKIDEKAEELDGTQKPEEKE